MSVRCEVEGVTFVSSVTKLATGCNVEEKGRGNPDRI